MLKEAALMVGSRRSC